MLLKISEHHPQGINLTRRHKNQHKIPQAIININVLTLTFFPTLESGIPVERLGLLLPGEGR